jgi:hypothetical protein
LPSVNKTEPGPLTWICDLPIVANWQVYAPNQADFYLSECLDRTDYHAMLDCVGRTGRGCCYFETHTLMRRFVLGGR